MPRDYSKIETEVKKVKVFKYLDEQRQSGDTNMFGATPFIQTRFGMERQQAGKYLQAWMDEYDDYEVIHN
jgi:hypothetical protein